MTDVHNAEYVRRLEFAVSQLAAALQQHRTDMHSASGRPCGTCRTSAIALGLVGVTPFVDRSGMDRKAALADAIGAHIDGGEWGGDWQCDVCGKVTRTATGAATCTHIDGSPS